MANTVNELGIISKSDYLTSEYTKFPELLLVIRMCSSLTKSKPVLKDTDIFSLSLETILLVKLKYKTIKTHHATSQCLNMTSERSLHQRCVFSYTAFLP